MKKFVKNIVLFLMPFLLLAAGMIPFYIKALKCGELVDIEDAIELQRENCNSLMGLGYNEQTSYYKLINADYYKADVLALGTSRVMQFKKEFFQGTFYNCGGSVHGNYNEYLNFLENLDYKPKCILLGLDAWVFNDAWNQSCGDYSNYVKIQKIHRSKGIMLKSMIQDWINGKWTFDDLGNYPDNIGFNGCIKDEGFMCDGSYYYGNVYRNPEEDGDYLFADTLKRIENGVSRFEWGDHIDQDTLEQLDKLLSYCTQNDIEVIGFLPPFAPTVYETMEETGNYGYLAEIEPACVDLFNRYNFEFYNYMDGAYFDVTDDYFIDGFHGSEIVYGYIIKDMVSKGSEISSYTDLHHTDNILENAYDGRTFYDPDKRK